LKIFHLKSKKKSVQILKLKEFVNRYFRIFEQLRSPNKKVKLGLEVCLICFTDYLDLFHMLISNKLKKSLAKQALRLFEKGYENNL
jgi:hypothetical protein